MRVPTATAYNQQIDAINQQRADLAKTQQQLSTGNRLTRLADDPAAAAEAERARAETARLAAQQRMVDYAKSMLQQAEGATGSAIDELQSVRQNLVQAANGTLSASDRAAIAKQLRGSYEQLLSIANTRDGSGGYVFGGAGASAAPFDTSGGVVYTAQPGTQTVGTDPTLATSQDGAQAFMSVPTASGTQSIFAVIEKVATLLEDPTSTAAALQAGIKDGMDGVDAGLDKLQTVRTQIGESLNSVDVQTSLIGNQSDNQAARLSALVDVDYAKAISDFSAQQTGLNAALKTYAQVAKMSLFDYL